jgi:hypothetical protein
VGDVAGLALSYDGGMRYAQRGGYTPAEQQRRERLRLATAERFARGEGTGKIARDLRVTERTMRQWRQSGPRQGPDRDRSRVSWSAVSTQASGGLGALPGRRTRG